VEDRVVLAGPVDHDEVKVWMGAADVFVLPSHSEGVATVLFEALYAGLPCVFTRVGGTEDVVADEETALLVPPGSVESLVAALRRLIRDSALRDKLSRNGNSLVREDYTWDVNARRNLDLFEDLL
jgi:glycosyltransferase involved in cell wall biosynthesis